MNVYVCVPTVEVLTTAGFQVPDTGGLSFDTMGNVAPASFRQNGPIGLNVANGGS